MAKKPVVELATVQYANHDVISEIAFRVYYGSSHNERASAAYDALSNYTEYFDAVEGTTVSIGNYTTATGYTDSGIPYVLFTFGSFEDND